MGSCREVFSNIHAERSWWCLTDWTSDEFIIGCVRFPRLPLEKVKWDHGTCHSHIAFGTNSVLGTGFRETSPDITAFQGLVSSKHTRLASYPVDIEKRRRKQTYKTSGNDCTLPLPRPPGTSPRVLVGGCEDRRCIWPPECSCSFMHPYNLKRRERVHTGVERVIHEVI